MKTLEEKNAMIAEFMGMQKTELGWYDNNEVLKLPNTSDNTFDDLLFHASWDWLMPVVDDIENTYPKAGDYPSFEIRGRLVEIENCHGFGYGRFFEGDTKLDAVYKAVVKFIEWYNENK